MTEDFGKKDFKEAINTTLSGLQGNPFLYERIAACAENGEPSTKHRMPMRLIVPVLIVLFIATTAFAASFSGGSINWLGEKIEDDQIMDPLPTAIPAPLEELPLGIEQIVSKALETYDNPAEMLVITSTTEDGTVMPEISHGVCQKFISETELYEVLGSADLLPRLAFIPEGYEFVEGTVYYDCRADGSYERIDTHEMTSGVTVHRYRIHSGDEFASGYYMLYRASPEVYHYISIFAQFTEEQDLSEQSFGYLTGQTAQSVTVAGMDSAISIIGENTNRLDMRRVLPECIDYLYDQELIPCKKVYAEMVVSVTAPALDTDTLVRMFEAE